jgi:hypothetical protein
MQDEVFSDYTSLPAEAQKQAADFIAFLRQRYGVPKPKKQAIDFERDPFIGMWRDREDMEDSATWVRQTRENEWGSSQR